MKNHHLASAKINFSAIIAKVLRRLPSSLIKAWLRLFSAFSVPRFGISRVKSRRKYIFCRLHPRQLGVVVPRNKWWWWCVGRGGGGCAYVDIDLFYHAQGCMAIQARMWNAQQQGYSRVNSTSFVCLQTDANRLASSEAALERKTELYDRLSRGEVSLR